MDIGISPKPIKAAGSRNLIATLVPLTLLLGTVLIGIMYIYPKYNSIPAKKAEITQLSEQNMKLETKIKKLDDLVDFKEILDQNSDLLNTALPSEDNIPLLLTQIQQIASDSGLAVTNLTYSSTGSGKDEESANKVHVLLSAKGTFNESKTFFKSIENASRIIEVSTMRFASEVTDGSQSDLGGGDLEITLGLTSPFLFVESKATTEDPITIDIRDQAFLDFMNKLKELKVYSTTVDNTNIGKENPFN